MLALVSKSSSSKTMPGRGKEQFWRGHINGWQSSHLSQRTYCEKNELALSTFSLWRRRLAKSAKSLDIVAVGAVARVRPAPIIVVVGAGRYRLEIADRFECDTLRDILNTLESRT